jgi:hypothetical protein
VRVDDVGAQLAAQPPDPPHVRRHPGRRASRCGRRGDHADAGGGQDGRREARLDVAGRDDVATALVHGQREVLHVRVVDRAEHQDAQRAAHAAFA